MPKSACGNRTHFQKGEALPLEREYTDYKAEIICKLLLIYSQNITSFRQVNKTILLYPCFVSQLDRADNRLFSVRFICLLFIHSLNRKTSYQFYLINKKSLLTGFTLSAINTSFLCLFTSVLFALLYSKYAFNFSIPLQPEILLISSDRVACQPILYRIFLKYSFSVG